MKEEINLDEIIEKFNDVIYPSRDALIKACMREAISQALELAAEKGFPFSDSIPFHLTEAAREHFEDGATHALTSQLPSLCGWVKEERWLKACSQGVENFKELKSIQSQLSLKEKEIENLTRDYKIINEELHEENKNLRDDAAKEIEELKHQYTKTHLEMQKAWAKYHDIKSLADGRAEIIEQLKNQG